MTSGDTESEKDAAGVLEVDLTFYSRDAILNTAYLFADRCWVRLHAKTDSVAVVSFTMKEPNTKPSTLMEAFLTELVDQELRVRIHRETADIHRMIVSEAFAPLEERDSEP